MEELSKLRQEIDAVDHQLLELIAKRIQLVKRVGAFKKVHNIPIFDGGREEEILRQKSADGEKLGLENSFIKSIWRLFFQEAYKIEK